MVRAEDVRVLLQIVGEIHDLPNSVHLRRGHLVARLSEAFHAKLAVSVDARGIADGASFAAFVVAGELDADEQIYCDRYARDGHVDDPFLKAARALQGGLYTWRRGELVANRAWYNSVHYNDLRRLAGVDDFIHNRWPLASSQRSEGGIAVHRAVGDKRFTTRDRNMIHLLAEHLSTFLAPMPGEPDSLPPRLQRTLEALLRGLSEKEVAADLRLSRHTIHGYVKELYRLHDVSSRPELMARCGIRR